MPRIGRLFVDLTFMPLVEKIAPAVKSLKKVIVLTDKAHMPETALPNVVAYEDWLADADGDYEWVALDEGAAAGMCYTSGTTGDPKGVVYSTALERAACHDRVHAGCDGHLVARHDPARGADVPCQRLGAWAERRR